MRSVRIIMTVLGVIAIAFLEAGDACASMVGAPVVKPKSNLKRMKIRRTRAVKPRLLPSAGGLKVRIDSSFEGEETPSLYLYFCPDAEARRSLDKSCVKIDLNRVKGFSLKRFDPSIKRYSFRRVLDVSSDGKSSPSFRKLPYIRLVALGGDAPLAVSSLKIVAVDGGRRKIMYRNSCLRLGLKGSHFDLKPGYVASADDPCPDVVDMREPAPVPGVAGLVHFNRGYVELKSSLADPEKESASIAFHFCPNAGFNISKECATSRFTKFDPEEDKKLELICELPDGSACSFKELPYVRVEAGDVSPIKLRSIRIFNRDEKGKAHLMYWNPCLVKQLAGFTGAGEDIECDDAVDLSPDDVAACVAITTEHGLNENCFIDLKLTALEDASSNFEPNSKTIEVRRYNRPGVPYNTSSLLGGHIEGEIPGPPFNWKLSKSRNECVGPQMQVRSLKAYIYSPAKSFSKLSAGSSITDFFESGSDVGAWVGAHDWVQWNWDIPPSSNDPAVKDLFTLEKKTKLPADFLGL